MWSLAFILLSVVSVISSALTIDNYVVINIQNNTLMSIRTPERSLIELNLSSLGLQRIDNGAFNNLQNVKVLILANNSLVDLPESIFSNLTNLEYLSVANNNIRSFANAFVGLSNLKTLNIANNQVRKLESGEFYGLNSSVNIFTRGNFLESINRNMFERKTNPMPELNRLARNKGLRPGDFPKSAFRVKVCIEHSELKFVDILKKNEILASGCVEILSENDDRLFIDNLNITSFARGWYRPFKVEAMRSIWFISLVGNNITEVTDELLNDLPKKINFVNLSDNKIERLKKGIIRNSRLSILWITNNSIQEIENGTFENTKLLDLNLNDNQLKDMNFFNTLPPTLKILTIERNQLTEIPDGSLVKLRRLISLRLDGNNITEVRKDSFRGPSFMYYFGLSNNQIRKIEPGCFRTIANVGNVNLRNNSIDKLDIGVFRGPNRFLSIDLSMNKFTNVTEQIRKGLPKKVDDLLLDYNEIQSLESGSFVRVPKRELRLRGNKISKIAKGSLNLPELRVLDLGNNLLTQVDDELLKNFPNLRKIFLDGNGFAKIDKGFVKYQNYIFLLDISRNPIKRLDNGSLFGIRNDHHNRTIITSQCPIEVIQGGVFDDV